MLGEPDPRLFEIATDLVEMTPPEAQRHVRETLNLPQRSQLTAEEKAALLKQIEREGVEADRGYEGKIREPKTCAQSAPAHPFALGDDAITAVKRNCGK